MNPLWKPFSLLTAGLALGTTSLPADLVEQQISAAWDFSLIQAEKLAEDVLKNDREDFSDYTNRSGQWNVKNDSTWCSGFVPGIFWYLYDYTGENEWRSRAEHWTEGVRSRATATDNDTGFQIFDSFGLGYLITGEANADYYNVLLKGAETLVEQRYNPNSGTFRSWGDAASANDKEPYKMPFQTNIDQMMNLELPIWVGLNGGPEEYYQYAIRHADTTWEHGTREDASTYHVVYYDTTTGEPLSYRTHQGWQTDSTWTRGQAWAVYGNIMIYRYAVDEPDRERFLNRAIASYELFKQRLEATSSDWVPPSDFDAPLNSSNPKDSSATAIVASALLEIYEFTEEEHFIEDARAMLYDLSTTYLAEGTNFQSILLEGSEKWGTTGKVGTMFGDYFFVEALLRYKKLREAGYEPPPPDETWKEDGLWATFPLEGDWTNTASMMGWLYVGQHPWAFAPTVGWLYMPEENVESSGAWGFFAR